MKTGKLEFSDEIIDNGIYVDFETFQETAVDFINITQAIKIIEHLKKVFEIK